MKSGGEQDSAEASRSGSKAHVSQNGGPNTPHSMKNQTVADMPVPPYGAPGGGPGLEINLNVSMDHCGAAPPGIPFIHATVPSGHVPVGIAATESWDNCQSQINDERELKRQRRKQSNRESAIKSRSRKQADCDDLAQRAESLKEENATLKAEVDRLRTKHDQLLAQNASPKLPLARLEVINHFLDKWETLGEAPGQEKLRSSGNDCLDKGTKDSGQEEAVQSGE